MEGGLLPSDGTAPTGEGQQDIVAVPELAGLDAALQLAGQDAATLPEGAQLLAEGDTTPVGQDDTVEAYAIPAGSAYIKEIGADITFSNDAENNAITNAMQSALTYIKSLYEDPEAPQQPKTATIIVSDGIYQGGLNISSEAGSGSVLAGLIAEILGLNEEQASEIQINIIAEDAVAEDGSFTAEGEGGAQLEGDVNINFEGLDVVLAGLYLSTRGMVNVEGAESVTYYGTTQDDVVDIDVHNVTESVKVDTGKGDDRVDVRVEKRPNLEFAIELEEGWQTAFEGISSVASIEELPAGLKEVMTNLLNSIDNLVIDEALDAAPLKVDIDLGLGNDTLDFTLVDTTDLALGTPNIGAGSGEGATPITLTYGFDIDIGAADVNILGGDGNDRIGIAGARAFSLGQEVVQFLTDHIAALSADFQKTDFSLDGGLGDDVITVDTTAAFSTLGGITTSVKGDEGFDRLHITGKLNDEVDAAERITAQMDTDSVEFSIEALAEITFLGDIAGDVLALSFEKQFAIAAQGIDAFTDSLENKRTIRLDGEALTSEALPFTNYEITGRFIREGADDEAPSLDFVSELVIPDSGLLLTNVIYDAGDGEVTVDRVIAEGMNVLISGKHINVEGEIVGRNILLQAVGTDDVVIEGSLSVIDDDLAEEDDMSLEVGLYEAESDRRITIGADARIEASEAVDVLASLALSEGYLPIPELPGGITEGLELQPFVLKMGYASVDVLGQIIAGGSVRLGSELDILVNTTNGLASVVVPIAVGVAVGESTVTVGGDAVIRSGAGAQLDAYSDTSITADTVGGMPKFALSLAVGVLDTHVTVEGNAKIEAQGDIDLVANGAITTGSSSVGKGPKALAIKPVSGVYIAGTFIQNDVSVQVLDQASLLALAGDLRVDSTSRVRASTVTVNIPANEDAEGKVSTKKVIGVVEKLLGVKTDIAGALRGLITGANGLDGFLDQAVQVVDKPEKQVKQFAGAFSLSYIDNDNAARVDTTGALYAEGGLMVLARGEAYAELRADASLYRTPPLDPVTGATVESAPQKAIGTAIGVTYFDNDNTSEIVCGVITAEDLRVDADMGFTGSGVTVKAGHIPSTANFGLGGAIAVHLASAVNEATVGKDGNYTIEGGSVAVESTGSGHYLTVGDASGKRARRSITVGGLIIPFEPANVVTANSTGVGAGIAVGLVGVDVTARIEDGVRFKGLPMTSALVNASYHGTEHIEAAAGAAGGTSVVPVLALGVGGVYTQAYLGSAADEALSLTGDLAVTAVGQVERTMQVDAAAVGAGVGVGGAFGIGVFNDSAAADLERAANAASVLVDAQSISRFDQKVIASAKGATPTTSPTGPKTLEELKKQQQQESQASGNTESQLDDALQNQSGAGGSNIGALNTEGEADRIADLNTQIASALAGSIGTNNVNSGAISALAQDRPRAQTQEGSVQVAAALALNILKNDSSARVGDAASISADGDVSITSLVDTDAVISANASATNSTTGVGVGVAINYVRIGNVAYLGAPSVRADALTVRADILEAEDKKSVEAIFADLMAYFADTEGVNMLIDALVEARGYASLEDMLANDPEFKEAFEALDSDDPAALEALIIELLAAQFSGETVDTSKAVFGALADSVVGSFTDMLTDPEFLLSLLLGGAQGKMDELFEKHGLTAEVAIQRVRDMVVTAMNIKFGNPSELDGVGNLISTTAISGAGAANVGVAGAAAITLLETDTKAAISDLNGRIDASGVVTIYAQGAQKVYTTATASADKNGMPDKNKDGTGNAQGKTVGVGASAAIADVQATSEALLGEERTLNAAALSVVSELRSDLDTISVAGSDPIARRDQIAQEVPALGEMPLQQNNTTTKDIAIDASVALSMIDNVVHAIVGSGAQLYLSGGALIAPETDAEDLENVGLYLRAFQRGQTYSTASGFAVGDQAAVGAAVGVNLANSDVRAAFRGDGTVAGKAQIEAITSNEDEASGLATVVGADLDRYLSRIRDVFSTLSLGETPPMLNVTIMNKINGFAGPAMQTGANAIAGMPLLTMLMQKFNVMLPGNPTASGSAADAMGTVSENASGATGQPLDQSAEQGQKINIAAAAGVTVTEHIATAEIGGSLTAQSVDVNAENRANYRTLAPAPAVTIATKNANNISVGVAVSVNGNEANATVDGEVTATGDAATAQDDGDVRVSSTITQNMDGKYRGLLGAQALSGSIGGSGGKVGFAGAVSILIGHAKGLAQIAENAAVRGGDIAVTAQDKSKLAVRAGGLTASGASAGIGASFALIYAENELTARVGKGASVTADSLTVKAEKLPVDADDYAFPFGWDTLFTVDVEEDAHKGLINLKLDKGKNGIAGIDIAIGTDDLLKVIDTLNYLASVNYYAESIAGAITTGENTTAAVAGSVAMLFADSITQAAIEDGANIALRGGDASVTASSKTNARMIGGAIGATSGKVGAGVNIASVDDQDRVYARIGDGAVLTGAGDVSVLSSAERDQLAVTVAAGASGTGGAAIGGGVNVIVTGGDVQAMVGENANITANGLFKVDASNIADLTLVSTSLAGSSGSAAVGGTVAVIVSGNNALASIGASASVNAADVLVEAVSEERLLDVLASLSGAAGSSPTVAGTIGVLVSESETRAEVGDGALLRATAGSVTINANGEVKQIVVLAAATGGTGAAAVGATVNVNVFEHKVLALIGENAELIAEAMEAGSNVVITASAGDETIIVTVAGAGTTGAAGIAGAIPVIVSDSEVRASIGVAADIEAGDSVLVSADLITGLYDVAGGFAAGSTAGVGATVNTTVLENEVSATIADAARIIAHAIPASESGQAAGVPIPGRSERRRGVILRANADNRILLASMSGGAAGTAGVAGVVNTLVDKNTVRAAVGDRVTIISGFEEDGETESGDSAEVAVEADDESELYNIAGGIAAGGTAGVGASAVVMVYDKTLDASIGDGGIVRASGDVRAHAASDDDIILLALSFAGGGSAAVGVGASVLVFQNDVTAQLGGDIRSGADVTIEALGDNSLYNIATALAGGGAAAVTPVAVVTYYEGATRAVVGESAAITANGDFTMNADSKEFITSDAAGVAIGGGAGVSGTVDVIISKQQTHSSTGNGARIIANAITVGAQDAITTYAVAGTIAGSGTAAVGVTAVVSVLHASTLAAIGDNNFLQTSSGDIAIDADSLREINSYAATAGVSGVAGVAATVMVTVVGGKLTQDSADGLATGFDADSFLDDSFGLGHSAAQEYRKDDLGALLEGDGVYQGETEVGSDKGGGKSGFDIESGYVSDEFSTVNKDSSDPGKDFEIDETASDDIAAASELGAQKPSYDPADSVMATIGAGATVVSAGDISVLAYDDLVADMITGTLSGGMAGVGVGIAVGVAYSNVVASVEDGASLSAAGDITISARTGSTATEDGDQARTSEIAKAFEGSDKGIDFTQRTIRAISISASGGIAGISAAVASVNVYSNAIAYLEGDVEQAENLTISAVSDYPNELAATLSVGGGAAAVGASVALVIVGGNTEASIVGDAQVDVAGAVKLDNQLVSNATTGAAAVGVGGVSVNGAVSLASTRTRMDTFIGQGVRLNAGSLSMVSDAAMSARAYLISGSVSSTAAVGLSAAVAILSPTVLTYIGATPEGFDAAQGASSAAVGKVTVENDILIKNDILDSNAIATILSTSASAGVSVNGNVLLVFNQTSGVAGISRANVEAARIAIDANNTVKAESFLAADTVGLNASIGISVSYVHLRADNRAIIDTEGVSVIADIIEVYAGRENAQNSAEASAKAVAGIVSSIAVGVNAAVADNDARNIAAIFGNGTLIARDALTILANGKATAFAELTGLNIGTASVAASVVVAVLRNEQRAELDGPNVQAGDITVRSALNEDDRVTTSATMHTGGGALINVRANVAVAYGRSASTALFRPAMLTATGNLDIASTGHADTEAKIENQDFGYLSATAMIALSYAQGRFDAGVELPDSAEENRVGDISIGTDYTANANVDLVPSSSGLAVNFYDLAVNVAIANAASTANAWLGGQGALAAGNVEIFANGEALAKAIVRKPNIDASIAAVAANVMLAEVSAAQTAMAQDVRLTAQSARVHSELNRGKTAVVEAYLGANGASMKASVVSARANTAIARADAANHALIDGATLALTGDFELFALGKHLRAGHRQGRGRLARIWPASASTCWKPTPRATSRPLPPAASPRAISTSTLLRFLRRGHLRAAGQRRLLQRCHRGHQHRQRQNDATARAGIAPTTRGSITIPAGDFTATGDITIAATATARALADIQGVNIDIEGVSVAVNSATSDVSGTHEAVIEGGNVRGARLQVISRFNENANENNASSRATVGSNSGADIALVSGNGNLAEAKITVTAGAIVSGATFNIAGAVEVLNNATSIARASINQPSSFSLVNVSVMEVIADAAGTFSALFRAGEGGAASATSPCATPTPSTPRGDRRAGGLSGSILEGAGNTAKATTSVSGSAGFGSDGTLRVQAMCLRKCRPSATPLPPSAATASPSAACAWPSTKCGRTSTPGRAPAPSARALPMSAAASPSARCSTSRKAAPNPPTARRPPCAARLAAQHLKRRHQQCLRQRHQPKRRAHRGPYPHRPGRDPACADP